MTEARQALERAREHGVEVIPEGERLRLRAPQEPPSDVIKALREHKRELLVWLKTQRAQRAIVAFNLAEHPEKWPVCIGAPGETADDVIAGLWRRYGDRLIDTREYERR